MYIPTKMADAGRTEIIARRGRLIIARMIERMEQMLHMPTDTKIERDAQDKEIETFFGKDKSLAVRLMQMIELAIKLEKLAQTEEKTGYTRELSKADYAILCEYAKRQE